MDLDKQIGKVRLLEVDEGRWLIERRVLDIPIDELGDLRPDVLVCLALEDESPIGAQVVPPGAASSEVLEWLLGCMLKPMIGKRRRPSSVVLTGPGLSDLKFVLTQMGIAAETESRPHPVVDSFVEGLIDSMMGEGEPLYTDTRGVKSETVAAFFKAAMDLYKLKPWKSFDGEAPAKVEIRRTKPVTYWAVVMGTAGLDYGLTLHRSGDELLRLFQTEDDEEAYDGMRRMWTLGFNYEKFDDIGREAQAEAKANRWAMASKSAYPSAIVSGPAKDSAGRPNKTLLEDLTTATSALVGFFKLHKEDVEDMDAVISDTITVEHAGKDIDVVITLPAPEFAGFLEDDEDGEDDAWEEDEDAFSLPQTPLGRAQDMVYDAWEEPSRSKRIKMARQAIAISPDCADAYTLLAEDAARDDAESEKYLQQAVEAGTRAIGPEFESLKGVFWGAIETRPYMRARIALADLRVRRGQLEEAISDYREMLELNPADNMGNRYMLFGLYPRLGRYDELEDLMESYVDESTAGWTYTEALLEFHKSGDSKKAAASLATAMKSNRYVVDYLLERRKLPPYDPDEYTVGSNDEAVIYALVSLEAWKSTPGAIEWLEARSRADGSQ